MNKIESDILDNKIVINEDKTSDRSDYYIALLIRGKMSVEPSHAHRIVYREKFDHSTIAIFINDS